MKIADFFVNIGVKGNGEVKQALANTKTGLQDLGSSGLAAKAAIVGVFYAMERMTAASLQMGTNIRKFSTFTGFDPVRIQQWGNAFRQVTVPMEEVMTTMQNLQSMGAKYKAGDPSMSQAFGWISSKTGIGIDPNKADDMEYMMQKGIEFMKAAKDVPNRNMVGSMLGLSSNVMQGMVDGKFDEKTMNMGGVLSAKQIKSLDNSNVMMSNLWNKISKNTAMLVAKDLPKLLPEISKAADQVLRLVDALANLADKAKIFEIIGKSIEGWAILFGGAADLIDKSAKADSPKNETTSVMKRMVNDMVKGDFLWKLMESNPDFMKNQNPGGIKTNERKPSVDKKGDLTLNFNIDGAQDPQAVVDIAQRHFTNAYIQFSQA